VDGWVKCARMAETVNLPLPLHELEWRGLVKDYTADALDALAAGPLTFYVGFDPTAASLHVGSLFQLLNMARLQRLGHRPLAIVGGGTGMIGDPSGKTVERQLLTPDLVGHNVAGQRAQMERIFANLDEQLGMAAAQPIEVIDNGVWLNYIGFIEFMRDIGKHFTVNHMLSKESVKMRLGSESGISFTEFSYMLLQAYDFLYLFDHYNCTLQFGGSDQYGNIVEGVELIRRVRGQKAHGLSFPLIMTASGVKFGKTEAGAVWLDAELTSPQDFYQFWLNTPDADAVMYLRYFTWLEEARVAELSQELASAPEKRECQRVLAEEVTRIVHGEAGLAKAKGSTAFFDKSLTEGDWAKLAPQRIDELAGAEEPSLMAVAANGTLMLTTDSGQIAAKISDVARLSGLAKSNGEARRLINEAGLYVNNQTVTDPDLVLSAGHIAQGSSGQFIFLRKGKKQTAIIKVEASGAATS
jgi:tyrosyl-tRNA synthetase